MTINRWLVVAILVALGFHQFAMQREADTQKWERWKHLPMSFNIEYEGKP